MLTNPSNFHSMGRLKEVIGTPAAPSSGGVCYIIQLVDDSGKYNGITRWPAVESGYKMWYVSSFGKMSYGEIKTVAVQSDTSVINCLAIKDGNLLEDALNNSLDLAGRVIATNGEGSVHIAKTEPYAVFKKAVEEKLLKRGINVFMYSSG